MSAFQGRRLGDAAGWLVVDGHLTGPLCTGYKLFGEAGWNFYGPKPRPLDLDTGLLAGVKPNGDIVLDGELDICIAGKWQRHPFHETFKPLPIPSTN